MRTAAESTMPRRAYSYLRISDGKQARGDGLRRQDSFAEQLCGEEGWLLDDSMRLVDRGVSAFHGLNADVGDLSRFLAAVKTGRVTPGSVLIVECLDRLSREAVDEAYDLFRGILKAGVWIATREPRRVYNVENTKGNMLALLEPLFIMARGHEESKIKSLRISAQWDTRRRAAREANTPVGRKCPAWVEPAGDGFRLVPGRAATVRAIFRLAAEGMGAGRITAWLRARPGEHPPFGRKGAWIRSYVQAIIKRRAAVGEYQPRKGTGGRNMKKDGAPIAGYYPAVVTEAVWEHAQAAVAGRRGRSGRPSEREANLFTGIVHDARSGERMSVKPILGGTKGAKRYYRYLVAPRVGESCSAGNGLSYPPFEDALVRGILGLKPRDVLPPGPEVDAREARIGELTARLVALDHRLETLQQTLGDPGTPAAEVSPLVAVVRQVAAHKEATAKELTALKFEAQTGKTETLGEVQSLLEILRDAEGTPEEPDMRRRVKSALRWLVEEVWVLVQPVHRLARIGHVQVYLRGGARQYFLVMPARPCRAQPWDLRGADFRAGDLGDVGDVARRAESA